MILRYYVQSRKTADAVSSNLSSSAWLMIDARQASGRQIAQAHGCTLDNAEDKASACGRPRLQVPCTYNRSADNEQVISVFFELI